MDQLTEISKAEDFAARVSANEPIEVPANEVAEASEADQGANTIRSLPYRFSQRHGLLLECSAQGATHQALSADDYCLYFAQPPGVLALSEIQRSLGFIPKFKQLESQEDFNAMLQAHYSDQDQSSVVGDISEEILNLDEVVAGLDEPDDLLNSQDEAPIVRLLNAIFFESIRSKASDIHIQPRENKLEIRFRLDGVLHTRIEQPIKIAPLIVSRIKVLARLDIAEKRLPQDGRIALKIGGRNVDMRVSTMPSAFGERVVMRLLDKSGKAAKLGDLGIDPHVLEVLRDSIQRPHGIVMVTGPTGSGKTTTLYGAINELDRSRLNIMTIEDPIEYYFDGISQTQINTRADMTFARGLRAILRQDPDVVMIGEIRDFETAEIAIQASLTGHLMLSTLHTNTAIGAVTRLVDMGLPPFLLASTLHALLSQRLVRQLCTHCRKPVTITATHKKALTGALKRFEKRTGKKPPRTIFEASENGCKHCFHTGYQGRIGVYEVLVIDHELRERIHAGASESDMIAYAREDLGVESLRDNGYAKVLAGITSIEEVLRVTQQ